MNPSAPGSYPATYVPETSLRASVQDHRRTRRLRDIAVRFRVDTPGLNELLASGEAGQQWKKMVTSAIPLGRFGRPDEVAKAVVFLTSDDSS